jgi:hypothetical protein
MKYIAVIDGDKMDGYSGFSEEKPRIYVHRGQRTNEIACFPIQKPLVVFENGAAVFLTQGHIDALFVYERDQALKEMRERMRNNLEEVNANASISGNDSDKSQNQEEQSKNNQESKNQSTNDSAE